jgi:hypothetical protein
MTDAGLVVLGVILWGGIATAVMSAIQFSAQSVGFSRLSLPFLIGTMFVEERRAATAIGLVFYGLGGWLFALLYFLIFSSVGRTGWWFGLAIGAVHGLVLLAVVMPILPYVHPRMATMHDGPAASTRLHPPGFLALHYGYPTPIITLLAHGCYGAILGGLLRIG